MREGNEGRWGGETPDINAKKLNTHTHNIKQNSMDNAYKQRAIFIFPSNEMSRSWSPRPLVKKEKEKIAGGGKKKKKDQIGVCRYYKSNPALRSAGSPWGKEEDSRGLRPSSRHPRPHSQTSVAGGGSRVKVGRGGRTTECSRLNWRQQRGGRKSRHFNNYDLDSQSKPRKIV